MFFLDCLLLRDVRLQPQHYQARAQYFWDHYSHFSHQRSLIFEKLKESLAKNCRQYSFSKWQRAVNFKYSKDPLSSKGSILNAVGGRFNIGNIDKIKFPQFPAIYIAEDRGIAIKEKFGFYDEKKRGGLSDEELILTSVESLAILNINGNIGVLDLHTTDSLNEFFNLIENITLPRGFIKRAQKLNIDPMFPVKDTKQLKKTILDPHWRYLPTQFDVPANSQIIGQIAYEAGIEGVLYPSRMSSKKSCLAIFPNNFANSESFIELDGDFPDIIKNRRLDNQTFIRFI